MPTWLISYRSSLSATVVSHMVNLFLRILKDKKSSVSHLGVCVYFSFKCLRIIMFCIRTCVRMRVISPNS
jgi:hypothetical protein